MFKFYVSEEMLQQLLPMIVIIVVITLLYLYVHVICYFQARWGYVRSELSLTIFCYVILLYFKTFTF